jgi:hypothetical protein
MSAWTCLRQGRLKDRSTSSSNPMMEGPCADSGEKHEPASDVDAAAVDSLKALDPSRPIREADITSAALMLRCLLVRLVCRLPGSLQLED